MTSVQQSPIEELPRSEAKRTQAAVDVPHNVVKSVKSNGAHQKSIAEDDEQRARIQTGLVQYIEEGPQVPGAPLQGIYEVESVLDVRHTADGKREFLIKWRGWGPLWNNWEPEDHILDKRMLRKFNKRPSQSPSPAEGEDTFVMQSKRRCAKQAVVKVRLAAQDEDVSDE